MRVARLGGPTPRLDPTRLLTAVIAVAIAVLAFVIVTRATAFDPGALSEKPELSVGALLVVAIVGWAMAPMILDASWPRSIVIGAGAGILTSVAGLGCIVVANLTDAIIRTGTVAGSGLGLMLGWMIYGVVLAMFYFSIFTVPVAVVWTVMARLSIRRRWLARATAARRGRTKATALLAIIVVGIATGAIQSLRSWQPDATCRAFDGATVVDASFSPDGATIAVITSEDPNARGTVWLLDVDSGQPIASWRTWVDRDVVTDGHGRLWWSAFEGEGMYRSAIMTAAVGGEPTWLTDPASEVLWDLRWTPGALVGMTANSHVPAEVALVGEHAGTQASSAGSPSIGALWVSPDRTTMITSEEWGGEALAVASTNPAFPRQIAYRGDPRSISITPDGRELVISDWGGGTRAVEIASGRTRLLLDRAQAFSAVSARGDLAWADDESVGSPRLCIARRFATTDSLRSPAGR